MKHDIRKPENIARLTASKSIYCAETTINKLVQCYRMNVMIIAVDMPQSETPLSQPPLIMRTALPAPFTYITSVWHRLHWPRLEVSSVSIPFVPTLRAWYQGLSTIQRKDADQAPSAAAFTLGTPSLDINMPSVTMTFVLQTVVQSFLERSPRILFQQNNAISHNMPSPVSKLVPDTTFFGVILTFNILSFKKKNLNPFLWSSVYNLVRFNFHVDNIINVQQ